jgi:PTS system sucrose-specific IIC component
MTTKDPDMTLAALSIENANDRNADLSPTRWVARSSPPGSAGRSAAPVNELFDQLGYTVGSVAIGAGDLSLFPLLDGNHGWGVAALGYASGLIVAYAVGFVVTWFFGFSPDRLAELNTDHTIDAGLVPADEVPAGTEDPADRVPALAGSHHHHTT